MSETETTTPTIYNVNIDKSHIYGKCNVKCSYFFKYKKSTCNATNNLYGIILSYDTSSAKVKYNEHDYEIKQIVLHQPSIHQYNGVFLDGEIVISHVNTYNGSVLKVCVPVSSTFGDNSGNMVNNILSQCSQHIPVNNNSSSLAVDNYDLSKIILKNKPFFSYSTNNQKEAWIVFGTEEAISITPEILTQWKMITKPAFPLTLQNNPILFYNEKGSVKLDYIPGEIYIKCNPTGNSNEETEVEYTTSETNDTQSWDMYDFIVNNPNGFIVIIIIFMILVVLIIRFGYSYITSIKTAE